MPTEPEMMFHECPEPLQELLRDLSRDGYIYLGRTGAGLTNSFKRVCRNDGTLKAISETAQFHDVLSKALLEIIAVEGPVWVPYIRLTKEWQSEPIRALAATREGR